MGLVAVLSKQERNTRLLSAFLADRHALCVGEAAERLVADGGWDVLIADGVELSRLAPQVARAKRSVRPRLLPVLLLTSRRDVRLSQNLLWRVADDLILTPVEKTELLARVEILLQMRTLSERAHTNYFALADAAPLAILVVSRGGQVRYANPAAGALGVVALAARPGAQGPRDDDEEAPPLADALPGASGAQLAGLIEQVARGRSPAQPVEVTLGSGASERVLEVYAAPIVYAAEDAVVLIMRDLTQLRRYAQQLEQSRKLEAIGRLAGGLAHDFNNVLTVVIGVGEGMKAALKPDDPLRRNVEDILAAGWHGAELAGQLLSFSRRQVLRPEVIDVGEQVSSAMRMARRLLGEDIEVRVELQEGLHPVMFDTGQLAQVLMNLAANARDAMPDGGRLLIRARNVELDDDYARRHGAARVGPHVELTVEDSGVGMSDSTLSQAFDPFFTTKQAGEGTGLGLSQVHAIVHQSGGHVWLYSEPGMGTVVKLYLPACDAETLAASRRQPEASPADRDQALPSGSGVVLVVEDDPALLTLATESLRARGYDVIGARSAELAIAQLEHQARPPDLLLADVVLPGMNGRALAEQLRGSVPGLGVVFMSGYSGDQMRARGVYGEGVTFLGKPFTAADLAEVVHGELSRRRSDEAARRGSAPLASPDAAPEARERR